MNSDVVILSHKQLSMFTPTTEEKSKPNSTFTKRNKSRQSVVGLEEWTREGRDDQFQR